MSGSAQADTLIEDAGPAGACLRDPTLLHTRGYIDGRWRDAIDASTFAVLDPADNSIIAAVADMSEREAESAIDAADAALPAWRALTAKARARLLMQWRDAILENAEDLATLVTLEQGKTLGEARGEIAYAAAFVEWYAEEAKRVYGELIPAPVADRRILVLRQSIGVCAAITPWNYPAAMTTRKIAPALAAGCTVALKPSELTPLSALALADLAGRAGVPAGVLNVVTTNRPERVGVVFCRSPIVRQISFTGSTEVGKLLMRQSADTVKKCALELGGNSPFIVFADADLDAAVAGLMAAKFRNAGQTCVCPNRVFVHADIHAAFADKLCRAVSGLRLGSGREARADMGPLVEAAAVEKVERHIADAVARGAQVLFGGKRHPLGANFFEPTVLDAVTTSMAISREETFGPVVPLITFTDEDQVLALANDTRSGLAAYFYTADLTRIFRVAEGLEYGVVGVNAGTVSNEVAPFGGVKESGLGREGSRLGMEEYLEVKYAGLGLNVAA